MIVALMIICLISCVTVCVKLNIALERIEDNLVDIEITYERMRKVITYLKDCIESSERPQ